MPKKPPGEPSLPLDDAALPPHDYTPDPSSPTPTLDLARAFMAKRAAEKAEQTAPVTTTDIYEESLATKIARIMGKADYLQKKGRNTQQGYNYAAEADYLDLVKPLLASEGIAFLPSFTVERVDLGQTKSGTPTFSIVVVCNAQFIDGKTGEVLCAQSIGQGIDTQDKAPYKAQTGAIKYLLSKTFLIPTGDDPESVDLPDQAPRMVQQPVAPPVAPKPIDAAKFREFIKDQFVRLGSGPFNDIVAACGYKQDAVFDLPDDAKRTLAAALRSAKLEA